MAPTPKSWRKPTGRAAGALGTAIAAGQLVIPMTTPARVVVWTVVAASVVVFVTTHFAEVYRLRTRLFLSAIAVVFVGIGAWASWPPPEEPLLTRAVFETAMGELRESLKPKYKSTQQVQAISEGGKCPQCKVEVTLNGAGALRIKSAGRGFVVMSLSEDPAVVLKNPSPGAIPLPQNPAAQRSTPPNLKPSNMSPSESGIAVLGTATPGPNGPTITVDAIQIPSGFKGTLEIRDEKQILRFDYGITRAHTVVVNGRTFEVVLGSYGEDRTIDGQHTIFNYTFAVDER